MQNVTALWLRPLPHSPHPQIWYQQPLQWMELVMRRITTAGIMSTIVLMTTVIVIQIQVSARHVRCSGVILPLEVALPNSPKKFATVSPERSAQVQQTFLVTLGEHVALLLTPLSQRDTFTCMQTPQTFSADKLIVTFPLAPHQLPQLQLLHPLPLLDDAVVK